MYKLGIDLGGTKIEGIILDAGHKTLFRERIATEQSGGYDHILANIKKIYDRMAAEIDGASHTFGIATPGALSPKTGLLRNSNTQALNNQPVKNDLEKLLGRTIAIQNDANCFAMAEAVDGAGAGFQLVFGVIMGTGCGGGIVFKQNVLTGNHAIAGEWGHAAIDQSGPQCWCGARGCAETLISGGGLERLYESQFGEHKALAEIVTAGRQNSAREAGFMQAFYKNFGRALANLISTLDPDVVVLGGGLSNIGELYTEGVEQVRQQVFSDYLETPIVKNKLGDSAGVLGAAFIGC